MIKKNSTIVKDYGMPYKELAYSIWYTNNRPTMVDLYDLLPEDASGDIPKPATLSYWKNLYGWETRADSTDIEVSKQTDRQLIEIRLEMMKRHAEQAKIIAQKAFEFLTANEELGGFDSAAAAVNGWVKAVEEEKRSTGLANSLTQIYSLSDDDLKRKLDQYLNRLTNVGESSGEDVIDAISTEETTLE